MMATRNQALDGLRGVAALVVVCSHFYGLLGVTNGNLGVDVFFVLSGFLITSLLLREISDTGTIGFMNFYARRALRLGPALITCVILFGAIDLAFGIFPRDIIIKSMAASLLYVSNWVRAADLWNMFEFGHTWSLAIEEQFYLLWPVLLLLMVRLVRSFGVIFAMVLFLVLAMQVNRYLLIDAEAPKMWVSAAFHTRADAIFAGALPALIVHAFKLTDEHRLAIGWLAYLGCGLIAAAILMPMNYLAWKQPMVVASTAVIVLHLSTNAASHIHRALSIDWLTYSGRISYGLYLYHYPLWYLTIHKFGPKTLDMGEKQAFCLFVLLPASYAISWASYRYIEAPALRLKERFRTVPA